MGFAVKLNKSVRQIISDAGINDDTLLFAAKQAQNLMDEYVPMNTGALAASAIASVENNMGKVSYTLPYAAVCYYGDNRNFSSEKHQKATAFWDIAMMSVSKNTLVKSVENYIKKS